MAMAGSDEAVSRPNDEEDFCSKVSFLHTI